MHILPGTVADVEAILAIVQQTVAEMKTYNNEQWDEAYPNRARFMTDVANKTIHVAKDGDSVMGFIVLDNDELEEYDQIQWRSAQPCLVVHRLAIDQAYRQRGVASALETFVCQVAQDTGIHYLKVDTHSTNQPMQKFLERQGYSKLGAVNALGKEQPFYCYDKFLESA